MYFPYGKLMRKFCQSIFRPSKDDFIRKQQYGAFAQCLFTYLLFTSKHKKVKVFLYQNIIYISVYVVVINLEL